MFSRSGKYWSENKICLKIQASRWLNVINKTLYNEKKWYKM